MFVQPLLFLPVSTQYVYVPAQLGPISHLSPVALRSKMNDFWNVNMYITSWPIVTELDRKGHSFQSQSSWQIQMAFVWLFYYRLVTVKTVVLTGSWFEVLT